MRNGAIRSSSSPMFIPDFGITSVNLGPKPMESSRRSSMKRYVLATTALGFALLSWGSGLRAAPPQGAAPVAASPAIASQKAFIDQYCVTCHNQRTKTAGLALDSLDLTKLPQ